MKDNVIPLDPTKKKPYKIDKVLPWPPSSGFMRDMEAALVMQASFRMQISVTKMVKDHDDVMKELENKRKL